VRIEDILNFFGAAMLIIAAVCVFVGIPTRWEYFDHFEAAQQMAWLALHAWSGVACVFGALVLFATAAALRFLRDIRDQIRAAAFNG
jgi:TRAP-type C4-dicarboxylate transport system permease small subunit